MSRGVATRPTLEQAAERERGHLARGELGDQPPRGRLLGRVVREDARPAVEYSTHTSTTTGRIIGLRRVRS